MGNSWAAYAGLIDEARISNIARTAEQIKSDASRRPSAIYTSPVVNFTNPVKVWNNFTWTESRVNTGDGETLKDATSLVAQWNFNETSGTTASVIAGSCGTIVMELLLILLQLEAKMRQLEQDGLQTINGGERSSHV